jgi:hypothetical protein
MAITAHWITAAVSVQNPVQRATLTMRADLIGFIHIPGRHTGEHLAHAFLHILDRIHITEKVLPVSNYPINALLIPISTDWLGNFRQRIQQ